MAKVFNPGDVVSVKTSIKPLPAAKTEARSYGFLVRRAHRANLRARRAL
ncbi:MAG: hypothetical protein L3J65_03345 [Robiginitomaculum sp.]|nr:hypothetical protein [Robiginitomaculum sp.]